MRGAFRVEVALTGSVRHAADGHAFLTIPNPNVRIWFPCGSFCTPQNSYCAFLGSPFPPAPLILQTLSPFSKASPHWLRRLTAVGAFSALAASAGVAWWLWAARPLPPPSPALCF